MNKKKLLEIAKWLEAGAKPKCGVVKFDMSDFVWPRKQKKDGSVCGTAACIAGTACVWEHGPELGHKIATNDIGVFERYGGAFEEGQRILGLTYTQAMDLFYGGSSVSGSIELSDITPKWAARCIRKLVKTGKVDWIGTRTDA